MERDGHLKMKVNFNISAIIANNQLANSDNNLAKAIERLSSGYRINKSKDDTVGMAITNKMEQQLNALEKATQNATNGMAVIQTAEGALNEITEMLQRLNELAVKGATASVTDDDRTAIEEESKALLEEIDRIASDTEYNSQKLLDGTMDLKGFADVEDVKLNYYSDETPSGKYQITGVAYLPDGSIDPANVQVAMENPVNSGNFVPVVLPTDGISANGTTLTIKNINGFEIKADYSNNFAGTAVLDLKGFGAMVVQIGANESQDLLVRIPKISTKNLGIEDMDFTNAGGCKDALDAIPEALSFISTVRSRLGSYENRLEHTVSSLDTSIENLSNSYATIWDTDMAAEMTEYTKFQVLQQAGTSILAQANQRPQAALQLLQ